MDLQQLDFAQLMPYAIFGGITFVMWAVFSYFSASASRADERLEELRDPSLRNRGANAETKSTSSGAMAMLEKAAPKLSRALEPKTELEQSKLKVRLANAGYSSPNAPELFLATKVGLLLVGTLAGSGYGLTSYGMTKNGFMSIAIGAMVGFYLPELILAFLKKGRQEKIFLQLPDALDLMVVCVEAGLGLDAGMRRVAEELSDTAPEVCGEINVANMQLQMGRPRREVLHDLGVRTGVDDVRSLAAILIQADKFGSSIAQALRVQSDSMRVKRSQMAEEAAQKTAVKMIFPLVLFIFPGIFVVLVGPAAIMLREGFLNK
jgi:tight adherence protein C